MRALILFQILFLKIKKMPYSGMTIIGIRTSYRKMEDIMLTLKTSKRAGLILTCALSLAACDNMNSTQQRMLSGGAAGAVVGTVGTVMTGGCVACGAAIGGAV